MLRKETKIFENDFDAATANDLASSSLDLANVFYEDTGVENNEYTYDANGNQITKTAEGKTETNTYDGLNQLIGFTDGETTASYTYDADGLRTSKTVDGETINHIWDGNKQIVVDMDDSDWYSAEVYVRGTNLLAKFNKQSGNVKTDYQYYTQNAHGDVVNLTDAQGAITKSYTYDAFGVEIDPNSGDVNVFRFCGEYFDTETGIIYLRARYYQASIGRFISRDSYTGKNSDPLSLNLYTYCRNNPIFYFDPFGHSYSNGKKDYVRDIIDSGAEKTREKNKTTITGRTEDSANQKKTYAYQECDDSFWGGLQCIRKAIGNSTTFEMGSGLGIGGSIKIGQTEVSLLVVPIRNEQVYSSVKTKNNCTGLFSIGISALDDILGASAEAKYTAPAKKNKYGNLNDSNPYIEPDAVWETDWMLGSKYDSLDSEMDYSINLGASVYVGMGLDFTLSFDMNNFFKEIGMIE